MFTKSVSRKIREKKKHAEREKTKKLKILTLFRLFGRKTGLKLKLWREYYYNKHTNERKKRQDLLYIGPWVKTNSDLRYQKERFWMTSRLRRRISC